MTTDVDSMNRLRVQAIKERDEARTAAEQCYKEFHKLEKSSAIAIEELRFAAHKELAELQAAHDHLLTLSGDGHRFRFLTDDHDDAVTRRAVRELLSRMSVMSYSAVCRDLDALRTEAFKREAERSAIKARRES